MSQPLFKHTIRNFFIHIEPSVQQSPAKAVMVFVEGAMLACVAVLPRNSCDDKQIYR
jgi:hypothetical protein